MYIFDIKNKTRTGIVVIFTWRILAKSTLHMLLPPTFRLLSHAFTLPNRRFYTPATDYGSVPSELGLRPIPSVMDLSGELGFGHGETSGVRKEVGTVRVRGVGNDVGKGVRERSWQLEENEEEKDVKHYDADGESLWKLYASVGVILMVSLQVLTKVIVYCGIAVLACEILPVMFEIVGWGVKSW